MKRLLMNLSKLIRKLQMAEGILKDQKGVHVIIKDSSYISTKKEEDEE